MDRKTNDILSSLRAILQNLDEDKLHLPAAYVVRAIEAIEKDLNIEDNDNTDCTKMTE